MATIEASITGEHFSNLVRTRLADLAAKAILSGYPKLSARLAVTAAGLGRMAKTGDVSGLDDLGRAVVSAALWVNLATRPGGGAPVGMAVGDVVRLTITPSEASDRNTYPPTEAWPWERTPPKFGGDLPITHQFFLLSVDEYVRHFA